jgi:glutathione-regulated potassium-efflux system protein KefB
MSLQLDVVAANWTMILFYVFAYMIVKGIAVYAVARLFKSSGREAVDRAVFMAQGGEFAFVLYAAATSVGIITVEQNAILTAIIIVSMVVTPLAIAGLNFVRTRVKPSTEGYERPNGLHSPALVIGFGRVGQIASQFLITRGCDISIIDIDVEMIDTAKTFGFKVYYGDGTRLDILHAAGAGRAQVVLVCVDRMEDATRIAQLLKAEFPQVPVIARAVDRRHNLDLIRAGADVQIRETFESALVIGAAALEKMGVAADEIATVKDRVRDRDQQRLQLELVGGPDAGRALFSGKKLAADDAAVVLRNDDAG